MSPCSSTPHIFCVLHFIHAVFLIFIFDKMKLNMSSYVYWLFGYTLHWCTFLLILATFVQVFVSFLYYYMLLIWVFCRIYTFYTFSPLWDLHMFGWADFENFNDIQFLTLSTMHSEVLFCLRFTCFPWVCRGSGLCFPLRRCFPVSRLHLRYVWNLFLNQSLELQIQSRAWCSQKIYSIMSFNASYAIDFCINVLCLNFLWYWGLNQVPFIC